MNKIYDRGLAITYMTVATLGVILAVVMYSLLADFTPMSLKNVDVVPNKVCPGELIAVNAYLKIDEGNYIVSVDPHWTNLDDGRFWDIAEGRFPVEGPILSFKGNEKIVYMSPREPGMWEFTIDVSITGRRGILPRIQNMYDINSKTYTQVVDCGSAYTYEEYMKERGD